jgi:hypothetical protein
MSASKHTRKNSLLSLLLLALHFSLSVQEDPLAANYYDDEDDIGQIIIDPNHINSLTSIPIPTGASNEGPDYATMGTPYADELTYGLLNVPDQPNAGNDNMRMGMTGLNAAAPEDDNVRMGMTRLNAAAAPKTPEEFECQKHNAVKYAS